MTVKSDPTENKLMDAIKKDPKLKEAAMEMADRLADLEAEMDSE
jgi:hypothetical protein